MHPPQFGPYRVVRLLGQGGMGAVYEATDIATGQTVAIKTLPPHLAGNQTLRARFQSEIDTLISLRHPGIAQLLGFGEQDGLPFFAMEFVGGRTLEELLRSGRRFSWQDTVAVTREMLLALKSAHDHGVVHRDLKPANLMFPAAPGGGFHVKLTDFGIARIFGETGHTRSGIVIGTPEYMAPEQAAGLPVDHRADLYCVGLVMFAMMTGEPPFHGRGLDDVIQQQRRQRPPRLATLVPGVPPALDELLDRLLDKSPANRPATAAIVTRLLGEIASAANPRQQDQTLAATQPMTGRRPDRHADDVVARQPPDPQATTLAMETTHQPAPARPAADAAAGLPDSARSTFTTVEALDRSNRNREARRQWWRIVLGTLAASAVLLVAGIGSWRLGRSMLWPSADQQYETILQIVGNPADLRDPCRLIKTFLMKHPTNSHADDVQSLGREIAVERLGKRSRHRLPTYQAKSEAERLFLEAIRSVAIDPAAAAVTLHEIIGLEAPAAAALADSLADDPCAAVERPSLAMWQELARRQLELVEPLVKRDNRMERDAKRSDVERAAAMLRQAAGYQATADDPTTGAASRVIAITRRHELLEELVEAFADKPHAAEAVAEARRLLAASR